MHGEDSAYNVTWAKTRETPQGCVTRSITHDSPLPWVDDVAMGRRWRIVFRQNTLWWQKITHTRVPRPTEQLRWAGNRDVNVVRWYYDDIIVTSSRLRVSVRTQCRYASCFGSADCQQTSCLFVYLQTHYDNKKYNQHWKVTLRISAVARFLCIGLLLEMLRLPNRLGLNLRFLRHSDLE